MMLRSFERGSLLYDVGYFFFTLMTEVGVFGLCIGFSEPSFFGLVSYKIMLGASGFH